MLLTLHQMIRSGNTDQLLETLSRGDTLRLQNVGAQTFEGSFALLNQTLQLIIGYSPPSNMGSYANYLDVRVKSWREMKHDVLRIQTESNRRSDGLGAGCEFSHVAGTSTDAPAKARRLRHLPVEKGLLREVKQVQRVLDALVMCRVRSFSRSMSFLLTVSSTTIIWATKTPFSHSGC